MKPWTKPRAVVALIAYYLLAGAISAFIIALAGLPLLPAVAVSITVTVNMTAQMLLFVHQRRLAREATEEDRSESR